MPKCVPMTRSSELRPLTLLLYVVPVTLMELLRRWGSGATSGSGGGGGGGGGGGTGTHTHIGNAEEEAKVYEGLQRLSWSEPVNWSKIRNDSVHLTHRPLFTHAHTGLKKRDHGPKVFKKTNVCTHLALCILEIVRSCSGSVPAPHTSAAGKQTARSPVWLEYPAPGTHPRSECQHSCCHGNTGKVTEIAWLSNQRSKLSLWVWSLMYAGNYF